MLLCIDVGNSHIYGGVFVQDKITIRFRLSSKISTSDELGIFLKNVLRENNCAPEAIRKIAICSVVPQLDYSLRSACLKYFSIDPFVLQNGVKTGLNIKLNNPAEVGADRIANAIAAIALYPAKNLIVIDFGTAVTFCAINKNNEYIGGVIMPGIRLAMNALANNTAKLPPVEIVKNKEVLGRNTVTSIQSGIFYGTVGACREIIAGIKHEAFGDEEVIILGTGGFASLFDKHAIFDHLQPDLVLQGLRAAVALN